MKALELLRGVNANPDGTQRGVAYRAALADLDKRLGTPLTADQKLARSVEALWDQLDADVDRVSDREWAARRWTLLKLSRLVRRRVMA